LFFSFFTALRSEGNKKLQARLYSDQNPVLATISGQMRQRRSFWMSAAQ